MGGVILASVAAIRWPLFSLAVVALACLSLVLYPIGRRNG